MQIHYFQRYHSKEILGEDESPEITFDLQVAGDENVPDAVISQKSFKIVVETITAIIFARSVTDILWLRSFIRIFELQEEIPVHFGCIEVFALA